MCFIACWLEISLSPMDNVSIRVRAYSVSTVMYHYWMSKEHMTDMPKLCADWIAVCLRTRYCWAIVRFGENYSFSSFFFFFLNRALLGSQAHLLSPVFKLQFYCSRKHLIYIVIVLIQVSHSVIKPWTHMWNQNQSCLPLCIIPTQYGKISQYASILI